MSRSKSARQEKPPAQNSAADISPDSLAGNAAIQAACQLYPPQKPMLWQKGTLAMAILLEIAWIVYLICLALIQ